MSALSETDPIVFYDGDCGFCNSSVQFILNHRKQDFYFVPLQSEKAKDILGAKGVKIDLDTIFYLKNNRIYDRSSAALQICKGLRGAYPLMMAFYLIPKFLRDPFYNFVAKRRHKLRAGYCALPQENEKKYFIG